MDDNQVIRASWVIAESEADEFVTTLQRAGAAIKDDLLPFEPPATEIDDYTEAHFEPLLIVGIALSISLLLQTLSRIWRDNQKPVGLVIDFRDGKVQTRPAPYLDRNTLVVITRDNKVQRFDSKQSDDAFTVIKSILGGRRGWTVSRLACGSSRRSKIFPDDGTKIFRKIQLWFVSYVCYGWCGGYR